MNGDPGASFTVTLADVYAAVRKCEDSVLSMQPQKDIIEDHEGRIRGLERWRYALPITLVVTMGNTAAAVVALFLKR
jgi:hypothetical protein